MASLAALREISNHEAPGDIRSRSTVPALCRGDRGPERCRTHRRPPWQRWHRRSSPIPLRWPRTPRPRHAPRSCHDPRLLALTRPGDVEDADAVLRDEIKQQRDGVILRLFSEVQAGLLQPPGDLDGLAAAPGGGLGQREDHRAVRVAHDPFGALYVICTGGVLVTKQPKPASQDVAGRSKGQRAKGQRERRRHLTPTNTPAAINIHTHPHGSGTMATRNPMMLPWASGELSNRGEDRKEFSG